MGRTRRLYVEALIDTDLDELWRSTQDPGLHQRWDLRFGRIEYLPKTDPDGTEDRAEPQRFRYATTVLPGLEIAGTGVSAGERRRPDGTRTSALRFGSEHPLSPIREGSGYWRYVPTDDGIRFLTGYDYTPGWGRLGAVADRVFRPLMGWATAWSFDRLRLWLERGIRPEASRRNAAVDLAVRLGATTLGWVLTPPPVAAAITAAALLLPPGKSTPAARRCRRRPPDRRSDTAPRTLAGLELQERP